MAAVKCVCLVWLFLAGMLCEPDTRHVRAWPRAGLEPATSAMPYGRYSADWATEVRVEERHRSNSVNSNFWIDMENVMTFFGYPLRQWVHPDSFSVVSTYVSLPFRNVCPRVLVNDPQESGLDLRFGTWAGRRVLASSVCCCCFRRKVWSYNQSRNVAIGGHNMWRLCRKRRCLLWLAVLRPWWHKRIVETCLVAFSIVVMASISMASANTMWDSIWVGFVNFGGVSTQNIFFIRSRGLSWGWECRWMPTWRQWIPLFDSLSVGWWQLFCACARCSGHEFVWRWAWIVACVRMVSAASVGDGSRHMPFFFSEFCLFYVLRPFSSLSLPQHRDPRLVIYLFREPVRLWGPTWRGVSQSLCRTGVVVSFYVSWRTVSKMRSCCSFYSFIVRIHGDIFFTYRLDIVFLLTDAWIQGCHTVWPNLQQDLCFEGKNRVNREKRAGRHQCWTERRKNTKKKTKCSMHKVWYSMSKWTFLRNLWVEGCGLFAICKRDDLFFIGRFYEMMASMTRKKS